MTSTTQKSGWVETTLGENIVDIAMGPFGSDLKVDMFTNTGVPIIKGQNLYGFYVSGPFTFVSEEKADSLRRSIARPGDIVITHRGTLGQASIVPENKFSRYVTSQSQLRLTVDPKKIFNKFLCFFLKSNLGQYELLKSSSQAGVPAIATPTKSIKNIHINLPPLPEQRAIAAVLSSLDEKIELLREQNKTLEAMAQELFHEWFVEFNFPNEDGKPYKKSGGKMIESELGEIPEGWRVGRFTDIAEILSGGTPKTEVEEYWGDSIPFFTPKDAADTFYVMNTEKNLTELGLKNCNSRLYPKNTVFITARGTVGKCILSSRDMAMNQSCYALRGIDSSNLYVFLLLVNLVESLKRNASGSVFDAITVSTFHSLSVVIPTEIVISKFADTVSPVFQKILDNLNQIQTLSTLRDELLPSLMKGVIRVKTI